jgi:hypothetical protein
LDFAPGRLVVGAGTLKGNLCGKAFDKPFDIGDVPDEVPR